MTKLLTAISISLLLLTTPSSGFAEYFFLANDAMVSECKPTSVMSGLRQTKLSLEKQFGVDCELQEDGSGTIIASCPAILTHIIFVTPTLSDCVDIHSSVKSLAGN